MITIKFPLPSLSTIVTVLLVGFLVITLSSNEDGSIVSTNSSLISSTLSLIIGTSNEAEVFPIEKMTEYGPDS